MKKKWMSVLLIAILVLSALALGSCSAGQADAAGSAGAAPGESPDPVSPSVSAPASASAPSEPQGPSLNSFTTTDLDGNEVTQDIFADWDLTMVNIWATFCGPCISEMPELGELKAEVAERGVNIVGIVADVQAADGSISPGAVQTAKDIVAQTGANYTHLLPSESLSSAILYGVSAVPTTVFVDSEGNIVGEAYVGARDKAAWQEIIDGLLAK